MKKFILIAFLALTLTSCMTTEKCKAQDYIDWVGNPASLGYGALYNWYAASNANFAPAGWHVPTYTEAAALLTYLGGDTIAGGKLKEVGFTNWNSPNTGATNEVGFNLKGSGLRDYISGNFTNVKLVSLFGTTLTSGSNWAVMMTQNTSATISGSYYFKKNGVSVRLIKDNSTNEGDVTDYDGNVYHVVDINGQIWLTSNWKCEHLNDGTAIPIETDNTNWSTATTMKMCFYGNGRNNR